MLIFVISQHVSLQPLSVPKTRPSGGPNSGTSVGSPDCSRLRSLLFTTAYEQNACNFRTQTKAFTTARLTIQFDVTGTEHDAITTLDMNYPELTCLRGQRVLIDRYVSDPSVAIYKKTLPASRVNCLSCLTMQAQYLQFDVRTRRPQQPT
jgi:hypothetical protein